MSSRKDNEVDESRRSMLKSVSAGAAGAAIASALATLGAPIVAGAKEEEKHAESPFFKDPPPWPKGTNGHIYDHLFSTSLRENSITDVVAGPQAYVRGDSDLPGAKINMGWQMFVKPYKLERESHHHDTDEYLFFLGAELPDLVGSFDGEIEYFMGPEYERHIITKPCILYIPRGFEHNPMDIKRVGKPLLFMPLHLAPYFNGYYQTGYMQFIGNEKID